MPQNTRSRASSISSIGGNAGSPRSASPSRGAYDSDAASVVTALERPPTHSPQVTRATSQTRASPNPTKTGATSDGAQKVQRMPLSRKSSIDLTGGRAKGPASGWSPCSSENGTGQRPAQPPNPVSYSRLLPHGDFWIRQDPNWGIIQLAIKREQNKEDIDPHAIYSPYLAYQPTGGPRFFIPEFLYSRRTLMQHTGNLAYIHEYIHKLLGNDSIVHPKVMENDKYRPAIVLCPPVLTTENGPQSTLKSFLNGSEKLVAILPKVKPTFWQAQNEEVLQGIQSFTRNILTGSIVAHCRFGDQQPLEQDYIVYSFQKQNLTDVNGLNDKAQYFAKWSPHDGLQSNVKVDYGKSLTHRITESSREKQRSLARALLVVLTVAKQNGQDVVQKAKLVEVLLYYPRRVKLATVTHRVAIEWI